MPGKHPPASTEEGISLILQAENDAQHREIKEKRIFDWKKHISEEAETLLQLIPFALGSEVADRSCHLVQSTAHSRAAFRARLNRSGPCLAKISKDGDPTASQGNLSQCCTTLRGEESSLVPGQSLPVCNICPSP